MSYSKGMVRKSQTFTGSGTWTRPAGVIEVDVVAVGGGGAGGYVWAPSAMTTGLAGGGGGGGQVVLVKGMPVTGNLAVAIGAGGVSSPASALPANYGLGGDTTVGPIVARGGSGGGCVNSSTGLLMPVPVLPGSNSGGFGISSGTAPGAGGGGGAGSPGFSARTTTNAKGIASGSPVAGPPIPAIAFAAGTESLSIRHATPQFASETQLGGGTNTTSTTGAGGDGGAGVFGFGGGGGGAQTQGASTGTAVAAGSGVDGGGNGAFVTATNTPTTGSAATANTGGGGGGAAMNGAGGASVSAAGGAGGSGIVIISWWE